MAEAGKALHLIYANEETGKFELGAEAVAAIAKIRGPVAVCAVCGRARQGKSFILNKLAQTNAGEGFVVGPTHRPCTKGIWLWSSPLEMTAIDGSKYSMLLIDTEGIDAYGTSNNIITKYTLTQIIASILIHGILQIKRASTAPRSSLSRSSSLPSFFTIRWVASTRRHSTDSLSSRKCRSILP